MKLSNCKFALTALLLTAGCVTHGAADRGNEQWVSRAIRQASLDQAIIVQSAIFPYHFVSGSAALNPLGLRDLGVLADHFTEHAGVLNVRRGSVSDELYAARTRSVVLALEEAGVEYGRVELADGAPGGAGMSSEGVIQILTAVPTAGGSMTSMIGGGSQ